MKAISLKNLCSILLVLFISTAAKAQDTLHLDFGNTQVVPDKPMEDKIVAWGKTLNGKKQDIMIVAYYHKGEFKKFAEQRLEEMFLSVNRKVRNLVNIKSQEAKKGDDYQRTRVDIIYYPEGQDAKSVAEKKKADEKAAKEAEEKKKKEDKNGSKKDDKKDSSKEAKKETKEEVKKEEAKKDDKKSDSKAAADAKKEADKLKKEEEKKKKEEEKKAKEEADKAKKEEEKRKKEEEKAKKEAEKKK